MKVIISHDIDHLSVKEHFRDLMIPKFMVRSSIELLRKSISLKEFKRRSIDLLQNKWQNLNEIMEFDKKNNIPSTFFIGMSNGLGLNYQQCAIKFWSDLISLNGFDLGVHGIAFNDYEKMLKEYNDFRQITGLDNFGIRMHYLRRDEITIELIGKAGYRYDSGYFGFEPPVKVGKVWEFPLQIMDTYEFHAGKSWQSLSLSQVKKRTEDKIRMAKHQNLPYLNVLMHDFYFSDGFSSFKDWYIWLIISLKNEGYSFINFKDALIELENNHNK